MAENNPVLKSYPVYIVLTPEGEFQTVRSNKQDAEDVCDRFNKNAYGKFTVKRAYVKWATK